MSNSAATMLEVVAVTLLTFAVVRFLFSTIGWLSQLQEDRLLRRHLDILFLALDAMTLSEVVRLFVERFISWWEATFRNKPWGAVRFALISLGVNFLVLIVTVRGDIAVFFTTSGVVIPLFYAIVAIAFDFAAAGLSLNFLRFAVRRWSGWRVFIALVADIALLYTSAFVNAFFLSALMYGLSIQLLQEHFELWGTPIEPRSIDLAMLQDVIAAAVPWPFNAAFPSSYKPFDTPWAAFTQLLGASIQTVLYLAFLSLAVAARLTPRWLQKLFARAVLNVTTDKEPVFTQLGIGVGALAALLVAVLLVMRSCTPDEAILVPYIR